MRETIYVDYKMLNSHDESSLEKKINELLASGVDEILVKPVLMSDGFEAKKLRERISVFEKNFRKIEFGIPVLGSAESIENFADLLIFEIGFKPEFDYLLIGHGLRGGKNSEYKSLSDCLHSKGFFNVEVACLAGELDVESYLKKTHENKKTETENNLKAKKIVQVYPLLINLGNHILKDIFGAENFSESAEKNVVQKLQENGFEVVKNVVPLSSFESFRTRYLDENKKISENQS